MDGGIEEGVGESSSPARGTGGLGAHDIKDEIYHRLVEDGHADASNPDFRDRFDAHFARLPSSYRLDLNVERAEDVLLHQRILDDARNTDGRPVYHARFMKLEENLDAKNINDLEDGEDLTDASSARQDVTCVPIHEIIFSTVDKPKLLSQDTDGLQKELEIAVVGNEGSWSGSSSTHSSATERILAVQPKIGDLEIDKRLLKVGEKIASGACGDLYRGSYMGQDVAIKVLRSEHLNESLGIEFAQEVTILREVKHRNVVRFIGACTNPPQFCIVTEFMPGGSVYDFLHKHHNILELSQLLTFALDVCKGMEYLHQNNIIHRDLKTANLLMDENRVVKVADFGVARFQNQGGVMTAETGTYRWMAPEVINHQPYDEKADVFSFAIVLWELVTSKVPYGIMTPLQAALGVRQGLRPELPENAHPRLLDLMQRCWETIPAKRPSFSDVAVELEELLKQVQGSSKDTSKGREKDVTETSDE